jgi:hypothetical protein
MQNYFGSKFIFGPVDAYNQIPAALAAFATWMHVLPSVR